MGVIKEADFVEVSEDANVAFEDEKEDIIEYEETTVVEDVTLNEGLAIFLVVEGNEESDELSVVEIIEDDFFTVVAGIVDITEIVEGFEVVELPLVAKINVDATVRIVGEDADISEVIEELLVEKSLDVVWFTEFNEIVDTVEDVGKLEYVELYRVVLSEEFEVVAKILEDVLEEFVREVVKVVEFIIVAEAEIVDILVEVDVVLVESFIVVEIVVIVCITEVVGGVMMVDGARMLEGDVMENSAVEVNVVVIKD